MNSSIYLFLLLLMANPVFAAATTNGDEPTVCPKAHVTPQTKAEQENDSVSAAPTPTTRPTPVRTRTAAPRTVSPRWHSMLPGMFR
jgi:hypothetical protein